jgi:hypothetical protein
MVWINGLGCNQLEPVKPEKPYNEFGLDSCPKMVQSEIDAVREGCGIQRPDPRRPMFAL